MKLSICLVAGGWTFAVFRRQGGRVKVSEHWVVRVLLEVLLERLCGWNGRYWGVLSAEKWFDNVVGVWYINERLMVLKVKIGKLVMNFVSAYAPQVGRT